MNTVAVNSSKPDRISGLPDDVLIRILSLLPTKFAVGTSVISTRWKFLFASVPNIDLSDSLLLHDRDRISIFQPEELVNLGCGERFVRFVDKLFRDRFNIPKFRLRCIIKHDHSIINRWILCVLSCNVRELNLWVRLEENRTLPSEIFTCKTLEVLKLGDYFHLNVPESVSLPNLKDLHLEFMELTDDGSLGRVLSGCPVLEDLRLFSCDFMDIYVLEISHPRLKNLLLSYCRCLGEYYIVLDTPNLQNLLYYTEGDVGSLMKNINSLIHADISWGSIQENILEIEDDEDGWLYSRLGTKLINDMHNIKSIYLSRTCLAALHFSDVPLATFQNLTVMELEASYICGWHLLPDLLASSPNLEVLVFFEGFIDNEKDVSRKEVEYRLPESVPVCLSRSLREIKIGKFEGEECEFELVEYILKSAQVLRKMVIGPEVSSVSPFGFERLGRGRSLYGIEVPPKWLLPTCKRLSAVPKCSKTCPIVVSWKDGFELCRRSLNCRSSNRIA